MDYGTNEKDYDHSDFISEMHGWLNICLPVKLMNPVNVPKNRSYRLISIVAENVFDNLQYLPYIS